MFFSFFLTEISFFVRGFPAAKRQNPSQDERKQKRKKNVTKERKKNWKTKVFLTIEVCIKK